NGTGWSFQLPNAQILRESGNVISTSASAGPTVLNGLHFCGNAQQQTGSSLVKKYLSGGALRNSQFILARCWAYLSERSNKLSSETSRLGIMSNSISRTVSGSNPRAAIA